jgi:hypothetical protein
VDETPSRDEGATDVAADELQVADQTEAGSEPVAASADEDAASDERAAGEPKSDDAGSAQRDQEGGSEPDAAYEEEWYRFLKASASRSDED